ncbi:T9SS type A sorting domain-containing protein [Flavobacterium sp.]|uniref:T9SS type A sorting domain-containing protein n=1 Tax=Flavobacterium sp. TaxID=239 RepID=UPI0025D28CAD|nr:T9SS type A sorting domain-containing protein [Flavobacterium sp.]
MKKLLLILLVSNFMFAQQPDIEIRLVNENIGHPNYINTSQASNSNDAGLNAILQAYNVTSYLNKYAHPYYPYMNRMISVYGTYPPQFIADLLAYSSVIESVHISDWGSFSDAVRLQLIDSNIGAPAGFNGNIVTTNDADLSLIFQNFSVFYYAQTYPSSTVNNTLRYYDVVCNCDKNLLKIALNNYTSVIETTENVTAGFLLSNHQFTKPKTIISPNPFSYNFDIQTEQTISDYSIIDITGKTIVSTSSKSDLDNQSSQLSAGIYILNLNFDSGQIANYKLVKK